MTLRVQQTDPCIHLVVKKVEHVEREQELHACGSRSQRSLYRCSMNFSSSETNVKQCFVPSVASVILPDGKHGFLWLLYNALFVHLFPENNVRIRVSVPPNDLSERHTYPADRGYLIQQKSGPTC
mmetsp:Transcript_5364/g.33597  ORF Transcript_5364/g.33597 Transcript_5364/m.33597 type:complete len:125 (-) Transcript_5364:917-1291(-)